MKAGIDIGYSEAKATTGQVRVQVPHAIGTPDRARFTLNGTNDGMIIVTPEGMEPRLVGELAIEQSRFQARREDRNFVSSDEYGYLMAATFTQLTKASRVDLQVVTGLPVAFYEDKPLVEQRFKGEHRIAREGRGTQVFRVQECKCIPQPFGTVLSMALDDKGRIRANDLAQGEVGIIDIGGKTTNLLSVRRLKEIGFRTTSISLGGWDAIRAMQDYIARNYPGLEYRDHELARFVRTGRIKYYGEEQDISEAVAEILSPMADQVASQASQLWNGGARLDAILISGGGALLLGDYLAQHFRHGKVVDEPVHANAIGFYNLAQRMK